MRGRRAAQLWRVPLPGDRRAPPHPSASPTPSPARGEGYLRAKLASWFALAVFAVFATFARAAAPAWVEMTGPHAEARLVADGPCPTIRIDGSARSMRERAGPSDAFANRVCAAAIPADARRVTVNGAPLALPKPRPRRLVIIGDSGCRLKGPIVQHCNDPGGWPFARVAALAAARKPDLVIHVGDYYYRETPCPPGEAACAGSPHGDIWASWKAELFDPAAPLLAAAPWVFVRGNHEDCKRGGAGWFRLLDAAPAAKACPAQSDTFAVPIGGPTLYILDSADGDDAHAPPDLTAAFAARLDAMHLKAGEDAWVLTHRPVWSAFRAKDGMVDGMTNAIERAAVKGRDLAGVQMVLAGHLHDFISLDFGPDRPAQLIVGTGGDLLDADATPPPVSATAQVDGLPARAFTIGRFGYFVFDRQGADWIGAFHDLTDAVAAICHLHARALTCRSGS